jgi:hypothetical protein
MRDGSEGRKFSLPFRNNTSETLKRIIIGIQKRSCKERRGIRGYRQIPPQPVGHRNN